MPDSSDLHQLAEEILAASLGALDTIPLVSPGLAGAPERSYVSPGRPAFDNCCDGGGQLTVNAALVAPKLMNANVAGTAARIGQINHVTFNITIVRCMPSASGQTGEAPTAQALNDTAEQTNADAWALWNHLFNMVASGLLLTLCDEVFFDGLRALDPSGGCAGSVLSLRAQLDGYGEAFST